MHFFYCSWVLLFVKKQNADRVFLFIGLDTKIQTFFRVFRVKWDFYKIAGLLENVDFRRKCLQNSVFIFFASVMPHEMLNSTKCFYCRHRVCLKAS